MELLSTLSISQLKPFGAKLTNVDLDSLEQRDRIRNLLFENGVLIIPADGAKAGNRPIYDEESLLQLAGIFGKLENSHPVIKSKDTDVRVQLLDTMGNTGIPANSFLFHSDMSWRINPSLATVFSANILPSSGGNTCFQNANLMYRNLSPELKNKLHSMSAIHSLKEGYSRGNQPDEVKSDIASTHPVVIKHPETDVPLLYVNENFTVKLVGMCEQESAELMKCIFEEASNPDQILSHSWTVGDVVVCDNLGVQHLAKADYKEFRRMYRLVVHDSNLRLKPYVGVDK
ncbi:MAG: TauD/TfdA family dioxygenase [Microcoleaceae cyanobacterium MO_207.B10]|nr:TauD/TfdA family dioxygenase [Microcoleaceae cyanobacterium MO_207.B10]